MSELTIQYMEIFFFYPAGYHNTVNVSILHMKILDYMESDKLPPFSLFMSMAVLYKTSQQLTEYWGKLCLSSYNMLDWYISFSFLLFYFHFYFKKCCNNKKNWLKTCKVMERMFTTSSLTRAAGQLWCTVIHEKYWHGLRSRKRGSLGVKSRIPRYDCSTVERSLHSLLSMQAEKVRKAHAGCCNLH